MQCGKFTGVNFSDDCEKGGAIARKLRFRKCRAAFLLDIETPVGVSLSPLLLFGIGVEQGRKYRELMYVALFRIAATEWVQNFLSLGNR
ncbi:hypothetical protein [Paraburkholderia tropica]|uniref:hypothetical protein n=1 Tax=Paraburkholderia tropica TaxID=92647 RepID=UPI000F553A32|nr:hypothetical protein [Paraburkholderia tropica]RQN38182.1 hypothetical protein EHZ25_14845 [Paraburkholderia tropica]